MRLSRIEEERMMLPPVVAMKKKRRDRGARSGEVFPVPTRTKGQDWTRVVGYRYQVYPTYLGLSLFLETCSRIEGTRTQPYL